MNTAEKTLLQRFFKLVEIKTKIIPPVAFVLALLYAIYLKGDINLGLWGCFFFAILIFDMCTTAINNLVGYKQNVHPLPFSYKTSLIITFVLLASATLLGLVLAYYGGLIVLILGIICFACGILYTFGPMPISALPFGEVVAALFYGYLIPLIALYISMPHDYYATLALNGNQLNINLNLFHLISLFMVALPVMATTSNIMLANNICDLESDVSVGRHTLVYYLGRKTALLLFKLTYIVIFVDYILLAISGLLPWFSALPLLLVAIPVAKNTGKFVSNPDKSTTFMMAIVNFLIIAVAICTGLLLAVLL